MEADLDTLLITSESELTLAQRVWGTGGWLEPGAREGLDWLTLLRLLGWAVAVNRCGASTPEAHGGTRPERIVVGCDPDCVGDTQLAWIRRSLSERPVLVVARAAAAGGTWADLSGGAGTADRIVGRNLQWVGPGSTRSWRTSADIVGSRLRRSAATTVLAMLDGAPLIVARAVERGVVVTLGFHPSTARDADGAMSALLKHLLICASPAPVAWLEWSGTMVLRMDDPGGAQNVHLRSWAYPKLDQAAWAAITQDLTRRDARLSIAYVAGWVDDGDATRGDLWVAGTAVPRVAGSVHPSRAVRYRDRHGHLPGTLHDYESEFRGIQALRAAGAGDVELHGYTHLFPDTSAWAAAPDRYDAVSWFREFGRGAAPVLAGRTAEHHPLTHAVAALERDFGVRPTTLICPGDEWTDATLHQALDLGLQFVGSYYLALRDADRFCWAQHVCAPYLDEPAAAWFTSELPVVGYFHDRELALDGVQWMTQYLDRWAAAGARRFIDFRELATAVGCRLRLRAEGGHVALHVDGRGAPTWSRPVHVGIRLPDRCLPSRLRVHCDHDTVDVPLERVEGTCGFASFGAPPCGSRTGGPQTP